MTFFGRLSARVGARRRIAVAVATTLVLAGATGTAELVARNKIGERFATAAGTKLGKAPDVDLGGTPALWQLARGSFPNVALTANGVTVRRMKGLDIDARLRQVRRSSHGASVRSSTVYVDVDATSLASDTLGALGGVVVPDPATGRLIVHLDGAGALTVPITPTLRGDTIQAVPGRPTFNGTALPTALAGKITDKAGRTVDLTDLPLELQPRQLAVTDAGLRLTLRGGPARLGT
ncbi:DUF2993 domain-containing protein [Streptomyces olivaceoviridis]|uniref:LmeA family phospholipid-binding protein n=1 Tax=Streptomyces olivaceoviridis TaxID=1921 RepID=UPI0036A0574D